MLLLSITLGVGPLLGIPPGNGALMLSPLLVLAASLAGLVGLDGVLLELELEL